MSLTLPSLVSILVFPAGMFLILLGMVYEYVDRKLVARYQNRFGPRWFQQFADMLKLLAKEEIIPDRVNKILFVGLPIAGMAGVMTAGLYVPLFGFAPVASFQGDLIVGLYLLSLMTLSIGLAGWNNRSRFSLVGATRTLTQSFAYEAPFLMALLGPALTAGSWRITDIVARMQLERDRFTLDALTQGELFQDQIELGRQAFFGIEAGLARLDVPVNQWKPWSRMRHTFPGLGREFMPPLDEGSFLYMPSLMPHASIGESAEVLSLENRAIVAVGQAPPDFEADEVIDGREMVALPAFFNAHCHAARTLERGWAEDLPFDR